MSRAMRIAILAGLLALTACAPNSLYASGQAWQRQACNKIDDAHSRTECLDAAGTSYEQYQLTRR
jgi:hypothetical protein